MGEEASEKQKEFESEALVHLDTLYNVALRFTGNASDAEDLVQDTVTKAYRAWDKYEPGTNCRAWLVTIMRNTFINQFRRRSKQPSLVDDEVKQAIQELPEEFRIPVVLSDVEGLSYAEIAEILDLPVGTVKSRLFRGRRRLQQRLYEYAMEMGYIR
jgi:RNA polymerase sigma-70 factor (ECF subfamily)